MNRTLVLVCLSLCAAVACRHADRSSSGRATLGGARPNIVFVITDDQGYGEMSCHGNPILKTPNLDRLHAASTRFTQFQASPTCAPTRASLLTGKHEFRSGVTHTIFERERLSLGAKTLADTLKAAGYTTGIFGKWHLGDEDEYLPNRRGFDEVFIHGGGGIGQTYPGSCGDAPDNGYLNPAIWHNDRFEKTSGYCTDVFFDRAAEWVKNQKRPFLAWISPNVPHDPFVSPGAEWEAPYRGTGLNDNAVRYYAMISHMDAALGRFLDQLDRLKLSSNTLVIFMTDNGHSVPAVFNAGMRAQKGTPYQGGIRVPSFWRWPGRIAAGVDCAAVTAQIDVLPTLAEIAGGKIPRGVEGRSLVPLLENPRAAWPDRYLFTHVGRWETGQSAGAKYKGSAVRKGRYKLINGTELYDLATDLREATNIFQGRLETANDLLMAQEKWWAEILPAALESEESRGPEVNPFKERYWEQYGKPARTNAWHWRMNPDLKFDPNRPRF